ncbi:signal recognition particle-docking protein FtsY [Streptococcus devriesei]|uniref:signal recognition particle-docking protein FtsY n=1 Tax=Streptococcus devriesei TaxID=231233 RepID=UPI00041DADFC|nr:signal recognition particle-docking protein FtsY [Streptococcus devriesei]
MGLFDRLFGKKKQEENLDSKDISQAADQLKADEDFSQEDLPEAAESLSDLSQAPDLTAENVSDTAQAPESDTKAEDLSETAQPLPNTHFEAQAETTEVQETAAAEAGQPAETSDDSLEIAEDVTGSKETADQAESESQTDEAKSKSDDFMADYYARKAALTQQISQESEAIQQETETEEVRTEADATEQKTDVPLSPADTASQKESEEEKYNRSLKKTRTGFGARLNAFLANFRSVDEEFFEELEEVLILSDVGVQVASTLAEDLRYEAKLEKARKPEALRRLIIEKLVDIYEKDGQFNEKINLQDGVTVMLFVGVNGVGKTTSIGKLAYKYKNQGKKVMLVAADTFRAGAVAQLVEWGRRVDVPVVTGPEKADPASVVYDGVERAVAEGVDILMIDTAGRLQNKDNLMAELEKIGRIIKRVIPDAPHETLLALDASTGQNALVQAKEFSKITPLTGLVLTKIDGTAKGGVVLAIRQELDVPVKFIGFGEKIDDIGEFNSEDFMKGLLEGLL